VLNQTWDKGVRRRIKDGLFRLSSNIFSRYDFDLRSERGDFLYQSSLLMNADISFEFK
jgi:hypothetical protein